jgi:predicted oxidoreductase
VIRASLLAAIACALTACGPDAPSTDADVIVAGAGIAGLAAALEASDAGATVLVIEWSSVPGGHAVRAGGFAMVDTALQREKGHADSPDLAYQELMAWGEDADPAWVRIFAERSGPDVYDWLTALGARFSILLPTPESSVPRFHFAGGTAVNVVVPMTRAALARDNIRWAMRTRVAALASDDAGIFTVRTRDARTGAERTFAAPAIVLATGGFQGSLELVRRHWPRDLAFPDRLLLGVGAHAMGDGMRLGAAVGAAARRLEDQVTFVNGLPNPRAPHRGLHVTNPASIWVDAGGKRFVDESASSKHVEAAVLALSPQTHWMVFDASGRRKLRIRDAEWLNPRSIAAEILDNPTVAVTADTIPDLAAAAGLPAAALQATVDRYNAFVAAETDDDFGRFGDGRGSADAALASPPFYALQLFPMTRKNLGGLALDTRARALDARGQPIPGLFAAGELTGVGGINGSHGGSGTFLAPSVLIGRAAGRGAAAHATESVVAPDPFGAAAEPDGVAADVPVSDARGLDAMLAEPRAGYLHFEQSHRVVRERAYACARCHADGRPPGPARTRRERADQLATCTDCH